MTVRAIPRSILFTPALSLEQVVKAWSYDADVHLIDLEDAVPPPSKPAGRTVLRAALEQAPSPADLAVRVNELGTIDAVRDLLALAECPVKPGYILLPMVRSAAEVTLLRGILASAGAHPEIFVIVETVEAVLGIDAIAAAADGLLFGAADFAAALGIEITWAGSLAARQAMVLAAARHGIACIDTPNFRLAEPSVLEEEISRVRELGFHGKATVHPSELATINRALRPNLAKLRPARRITEAVRAANGGIAVLDGTMVGPPFARMARAATELGDAWAARFGRAS
ncbi:citrate lyase subunit beta / citryl-CoA lyase/(S)-citramalyl-CoA lyase [Amycolatopsis xylanica]|uniref:Citrate lyase subunit beta / citryl-CoA lyase/(S)-citramalyl-CoA lyase n=1 Tax=Amycolatopsis xylanica TaxID=589385 RepID=A0A1H3RK68_9PSEU|nr:aldolase/citrate lyase family protein [Amycolatopsis xylanica]SDZ25631.1 citrate lyase subunit beta / citryl-CoA lyase/(S)-citramalyl-CoA lyase [Amycolatopsis xylanica]